MMTFECLPARSSNWERVGLTYLSATCFGLEGESAFRVIGRYRGIHFVRFSISKQKLLAPDGLEKVFDIEGTFFVIGGAQGESILRV